MDKYRIDSHKLIYHVERVNDWLKGKPVYPIYMEISTSGSCNHRCVYCGLDFMGYQPRFLETRLLLKRLTELGRLGVKSIMYAGEGEPLLHKDIKEIILHTKKSGIDVAVTSNGVFFTTEVSSATLPYITWIKISINAGTAKTYSAIHRTREADFARVLANMEYAAKFRRKNKLASTLGMQMILLPENYNEAGMLARKARDIGMDYLVIKPYSQHPQSHTRRYAGIRYSDYLSLANSLQKYNSKGFSVIFRINAMKKWDEASRSYRHCLALPFWAHIDAGGNVWACSVYLSKDKFKLGNIYDSTFRRIWEGQKKLKLMKWAAERLDTDTCRVNCRMDEINRYLWELKNPGSHVNFI